MTRRPCPFCSSSNIVAAYAEDGIKVYLRCQDCFAGGPVTSDLVVAEPLWNRRFPQLADPDTIAQLRDELLAESNKRARGITTLVDHMVTIERRLAVLEQAGGVK